MITAPSRAVPQWTEDELRTLDRITMQMASPVQVVRIDARLSASEFEKEHGCEKCMAMFAHLLQQDNDKKKRR